MYRGKKKEKEMKTCMSVKGTTSAEERKIFPTIQTDIQTEYENQRMMMEVVNTHIHKLGVK